VPITQQKLAYHMGNIAIGTMSYSFIKKEAVKLAGMRENKK